MTGALLYDPDCGFCTRSAHVLEGWRLGCAVLPMSPELLTRYGIDAERAGREIPFVAGDGRVSFGAPAIAAALRTGPPPAALAGAGLDLPGVRLLAAHAYRWVAAHRHELPGGSAACRLDDGPGH